MLLSWITYASGDEAPFRERQGLPTACSDRLGCKAFERSEDLFRGTTERKGRDFDPHYVLKACEGSGEAGPLGLWQLCISLSVDGPDGYLQTPAQRLQASGMCHPCRN